MLGYIISDKENINVEEHKIKSFNTLHNTILNIFVIENNKVLYKNNIINFASNYGHVQVLEWYKNSGYDFNYNKRPFYYASCNGHVQVLKWFKNSDFELKYDKDSIIWSSYSGHYQVLNWFKNHNVKKVIKWSKWSKSTKFLKTIKYKTKNNYVKGYNKN
jgi:hypothetical protein